MDAYIGIDQSYSAFGLSILTEAGHTTTVDCFARERSGHGVVRLHRIGRWLSAKLHTIAAQYTVRHVCMEGYNFGAAHGREESGELGAVVKSALYCVLPRPACFPTIVAPPSLKKFACDDGSASKEKVLAAVAEKWGIDFTTLFNRAQADGAADAYTLARIAQAMVIDPEDLVELRVRDALTPYTERPLGFLNK